VDHAYTLAPNQTDTVLIRVDIAPRAPAEKLGISLGSDSVLFSIGEEEGGARVPVCGEYFCSMFSIMSERFEEYVHNYPNPFGDAGHRTTKIAYFLTEDADVKIRIYDLAGTLVWSKDIAAGEDGGRGTPDKTEWKVEWDGYNSKGRLVRNGVYLCRIQAGSRSATFKIAVAK
jgi:hypothetical protein